MDMTHLELAVNGSFGRIFEVQINQNWCNEIATALFYEVERSSLLGKEVFMKQIQEMGIFVIGNGEFSTHDTHAGERARFALFRNAMRIQKLAKLGLENVFHIERHRDTTCHSFLDQSILFPLKSALLGFNFLFFDRNKLKMD